MGYISPLAVIGEPPEHRQYIWAHYNETPQTFLEPQIHPDAIVNALCTIDAGIDRPTTVGARTLLMKRVHIGHDAQIGADCELGAGVVICGNVEVGDRVQIGGNTWIRPGIKVGDGARLGGGAVVVKDVPAGAVWAGNPARPLVRGREAARRGQSVDYSVIPDHVGANDDPHFHVPVPE